MSNQSTQERIFHYSVIRVVPDPVRDEAVNIGVVVADARSGQGRMRVRRRVVSRVRAIHRRYSDATLERSLKDLASALGVDSQLELGETKRVSASLETLESMADYLSNQLQMTPPQAYRAGSADEAMDRLFRRYVSAPRGSSRPQAWMTRSALKERMWSVVRRWKLQDLEIEQPTSPIRGHLAKHPADIVIRNGHPKVALYALATHPDDRNLSYFFRDSLPTIARDMGGDFIAYAVLPPRELNLGGAEREFAEETVHLLAQQSGVEAVYLDQLDDVRESVIDRLF